MPSYTSGVRWGCVNMVGKNEKLEAVLALLCEATGGLAMTQAVKLPYLVDVVARHALGRPVLGATYEAWDYGVVTKEAWVLLNYEPPSAFKVERHPYSEVGFVIKLRCRGDIEGALTDEEREIVGYVAEQYAGITANNLGLLTKRMNPQVSKWGSNETAATDEDAYFRLSQEWESTCKAIDDADLDDESKWGDLIRDPREHLRRALG